MQAAQLSGNIWQSCLLGGALLGTLALSWAVRIEPLLAGEWLRIDALSAWFTLATLFALLLLCLVKGLRPGVRLLGSLACILLAYMLPFTLALAACFGAASLLQALPPGTGQLRRAAPWILSGASLLLGYGVLALGGAPRYDTPTAGAALTSFSFWFVLLAALAPVVALARRTARQDALDRALALAWLYPLARLYSLAPWNIGWSLAAALLAGALSLWCAGSVLLTRQPVRAARSSAAMLAAALAGIALGTNAGLVGGCYCLLGYAVLLAGPCWQEAADRPQTATGSILIALPFMAPFVGIWMLIGACMAGGAALLAGAFWLAALLAGIGWALWGATPNRLVGALSAALGLAAPLVVHSFLAPVAGQLQSGLTLYGNANVWPWVGLATTNAAQVPVTSWPSFAVVLLLGVLCALVYIVGRLYGAPAPGLPGGPARLVGDLRDQVPWLAVLGPAESAGDEPE